MEGNASVNGRNVVNGSDPEPMDRFRPPSESPDTWPWLIGLGRIAIVFFVAVGTYLVRADAAPDRGPFVLAPVYIIALAASVWYVASFVEKRGVSRKQTWVQVFIDYFVVAATVYFSSGPISVFTFLMVIVILEAGLLLGMSPSFLFAAMASVFMLLQVILYFSGLNGIPTEQPPGGPAALWYNLLIQCLAFFLTAFLSGYWNQRIHRLQQFQRDILNNMNSGILMTDLNGTITAQNKAADHILGLVEHAAIGRPVASVLRTDGECPVVTALRSHRDFTSYEFYVRIGHEKLKLLGLTTSRLCDAKGNMRGIIASFTDLTEMSQVRQELQRQDRMAVVGELAAGLAHEIRNPVAVIRGAVDELQSSIQSPELAARLASIAIRESDHLNEIVSGFLDFARNPVVRKQSFDLREVVEDVAGTLRMEYPGDGLRIDAECPDAPCAVSGDPSQLKQVLVNLAKNGIEAMEERGALAIRLQAPRQGPIQVRVEDSGPGIAPDKLARIFEPFYTTKEKGVGMGLAVCARIITAHDGTIRAALREGGGTAMIVSLPPTLESETAPADVPTDAVVSQA